MGELSPKGDSLPGAPLPEDSRVEALPEEVVRLRDLRPHPRNYKYHPDDQLEHLGESLLEFGMYRNVVVASDGTILAGHGVVQAAIRSGLESGPVRRMPFGPDDPRALKLIALDNEVSHLAENDDRVLSELLREIRDTSPAGLFGTGYDESMLAALVMVTRPASEISGVDAAAEWAGGGMPEYDKGRDQHKLIVTFADEAGRGEFLELIGAKNIRMSLGQTWSIAWPLKERRDDWSSIKFEPK